MPLLLAGLACAEPPSGLSRPNRVAVAADGTVYASDFQHDRIVVFDADGRYLRAFGRQGLGEGELWRVTAMTVDPDGALVVANRRPETDARSSDIRFELIRFVDGAETDRIPLDGRTLQPDGWVDGLAPNVSSGAPNGGWIVADSTHGELVEVDVDGRRRGAFGGIGRPDAAPSTMSWDGDALVVVEQHRHRVSRVRAHGGIEDVDLGRGAHDPAGASLAPRFPSALAVCPGTWYAVADLGRHKVQRYATDGTWLDAFAPAPAGPDQPVQLVDIGLSPDCGRLYLVDSKGDRILVTTPTGTVLHTVTRW